LKTEDLLERRLPFIVFKKGLAKTPQHARQMVVHKKILIDDKTVNVPSYTVSINEESAIKIRPTKEKKVQKNKAGATEATAQETTH
jgi:small subunit ribosomal protein S4